MSHSFVGTYVLPFRRSTFREEEVSELSNYLALVGETGYEVLVVDGSPPFVFQQNAISLGLSCRHVRVDRRFGYLNDKVNGVHTGVEMASSEKIILADDDIRYSPEDLKGTARLLDRYEVVRPQNFLRPLPWWARIEAARMLINRALLRAADYPGTCAFRRQTMLAVGHYDGDVLFDNEEIIRHFVQKGSIVAYANDFLIQKRPPTFSKWLEQRPRQAYEDFGLRLKTAFFLLLIPFLLIVGVWSAGAVVVAIANLSLAIFGVAYLGRHRGAARRFIPVSCCFFAPLWLAERALSTYCAVYWRCRRGGYPFGDKVLSKGVGRDWRLRNGSVTSRCRTLSACNW